MKSLLSHLFQWQPARETLAAAVAGLVVVSLSAAMIPLREMHLFGIIIRDIAMIFLAGILFPLMYINRSGADYTGFGLSLRRWYVFLPLNLVLGALLLLMFLSEVPPPPGFNVDSRILLVTAYVMLAGVFEVIFFYAFLRTLFERAFGIIPGIILTSIIYSLHHAGFQPEFGKLVFVGIMYATVYRAGNSALLIYPFFWGIGASYDVLIQSQEVSQLFYPGIRSLCLLVLISAALLWARKRAK